MLGGVIPTLPDSAVDDEFSDAEGEEAGQVVIMIAAATLIDGVAGVTSWSGEIGRYWVALYNCFAAGLARRSPLAGDSICRCDNTWLNCLLVPES
mgnify:CR=1 FL=1